MDRYEIEIPKRVAKQIRSIPLPWRNRIWRAMDLLREKPFLGERMQGEYADIMKLKVWPYRIFYIVFSSQRKIVIVRAKHRGSVEY
ncbi:MAG: type II toxin-antitoxin system RelE/ParE family toxin [Candidatus Wildermuthbacteria bacterium]|nr:type II toxin-antitoxin system RelE/ParE family toxin [Candidatus Wildermuthbacteria bacterium]